MKFVDWITKAFIENTLQSAAKRANQAYLDVGSTPRAENFREVVVNKELYVVADIQPSPGLEIAEFLGEVMFPYDFDNVYAQADAKVLEQAGVYIDQNGRPEAIVDLKYGSLENHFASLKSIKPIVKLMSKVEIRRDAYHYDEQVEIQNIRYHMEREGLPSDKVENFFTQSFYKDLSVVTGARTDIWRDDYWYDGQFLGHSMWATNSEESELYWIAPVMSRSETHRKMRVGNLMFLLGLKEAYDRNMKTVNMGVDEFDYKAAFWNTRRIFKPGLRRLK